ncbi:MAG: YggU family protein [Rhodocyclales bacterium]|nr:YggU family protein [Rhodocyclales bacterium]
MADRLSRHCPGLQRTAVRRVAGADSHRHGAGAAGTAEDGAVPADGSGTDFRHLFLGQSLCADGRDLQHPDAPLVAAIPPPDPAGGRRRSDAAGPAAAAADRPLRPCRPAPERTARHAVSWILADGNGVILRLHIQPGAKKTEVAGLHGEALKIRLSAPPVDGKANACLIEFLARQLAVAKSAVELISGETARAKRVRIAGIGADAVIARLS